MYKYKIMGAGCLCVASFIASLIINSAEKKRVERLGAFSKLIKQIGAQIESFNLPIAEIFARIDSSIFLECGYLRAEKATDFTSFLHGCPEFEGETKRLLQDFSAELGRSYRDEQIKLCSYYGAQLEALFQKSFYEMPKKRRMTTTLCICAALALTILFI